MGTFTITSSTLNNGYDFKNASVTVQGSYTKDATTDTLQNVSGQVYELAVGGSGEYIGNFNGYMRDGEVRYSLSEMSRRKSNMVWDAIDEIEMNIIGSNNGEE
jgi:hypothetical protein